MSSLRQLAGLLVLLMIASGCAHTQTRSFDTSAPDIRAEINSRANRGKAVLTLTTGEQIASSTLRLDAQQASWTDWRTGEPRSVSLDAVQAIRVQDRRSYVLRDLGIGLATGAATGLMMGSQSEPNIIFSRQDLQLMSLAAGAIIGTSVGALVGYELGRMDYVVPTGFASARRPSGGG